MLADLRRIVEVFFLLHWGLGWAADGYYAVEPFTAAGADAEDVYVSFSRELMTSGVSVFLLAVYYCTEWVTVDVWQWFAVHLPG